MQLARFPHRRGAILRRVLSCSALVLLVPCGAAQSSPADADAGIGVSPQGRLRLDRSGTLSPQGTMRVERASVRADVVAIESSLRVFVSGEPERVVPSHSAAGVWATDAGRIVLLGDHCSNVAPRPLTVLDADGTVAHSRSVSGVTAAVLSDDGRAFAYRHRAGITVLDLEALDEWLVPSYDVFAVASATEIAGAVGRRVERRAEGAAAVTFEARESVRGLAFLQNTLVIAGARDVVALPTGRSDTRLLHRAPLGVEIRDLAVRGGNVLVGERAVRGARVIGRLVQLGVGGTAQVVTSSTALIPSAPDVGPSNLNEIPWPLAPNQQHPIGNSYAEYQRYGGSPYLHPGLDVMGTPGQPVYAVEGGQVKAILTTSGQYHWRVATASAPGPAESEGYLYAHLIESTIAVNVGDVIAPGQYLGDLVPWPLASFTHVHFARIVDSGPVWQGNWRNVDNPHLELPRLLDATAPVFEPAIGADLFAFCRNDTSTYLTPNALDGEVDIIAHVGDTIESTWVCAVQTLRYSIHPVGSPDAPVVDARLAVAFDMGTDTYANGPVDPFLVGLLYKEDSVCNTDGDYGSREFFHILTNSNGDTTYEASDVAESWDTTLVTDGSYVITVTATDANGNSTTASMTVTVDNP